MSQSTFIAEISAICSRYSGDSYYFGTNIPAAKRGKAKQAYSHPDGGEIIALIDTTIMGSAKDGLIVTETGISWNNGWLQTSPRTSFRWDELAQVELLKDEKAQIIYIGVGLFFLATSRFKIGDAFALLQELQQAVLNQSSNSAPKSVPELVAVTPDELYKIVFDGATLMPGTTLEVAQNNLARLYKRDVDSIMSIFNGKTRVLQKGLNASAAERYISALKDAGVVAVAVPDVTPQASSVVASTPSVPPQSVIQPTQEPSLVIPLIDLSRIPAGDSRNDAIKDTVQALTVTGNLSRARSLFDDLAEGDARNHAAPHLIRAYLEANDFANAKALLVSLNDEDACENVCADVIENVDGFGDFILFKKIELYGKLLRLQKSDKATERLIDALKDGSGRVWLDMAHELFEGMKEGEARSEAGNILLSAYGDLGALDKAEAVFAHLSIRERKNHSIGKNLGDANSRAIKLAQVQSLFAENLPT